MTLALPATTKRATIRGAWTGNARELTTSARPGGAGGAGPAPCIADARLTQQMDLFRRTGDREAFEVLATLAVPKLLERVRMRARHLAGRVDPHEIVQDTLINIYLYPDRFDASRPGAFRAWSSMILDNVLRRWLKRNSTGPRLQPVEWLVEEPDLRVHEPMAAVIRGEEDEQDLRTWRMFLALYLKAYQGLSERERFVLAMVEVHGLSYADLAHQLGVRREALKMAVFRARRRLLERAVAAPAVAS